MAHRSDNTPAGWPFVIVLLTLIGLAVGAHLQLKRQGLPIQTHSEPEPCSPAEGLVCTDVQHIERLLRDEN